MNNTSTPISMTVTNSTIVDDGIAIYDRSSGSPPRTDAPTGDIYLRGVNITGSYNIQSGMQINVYNIHAADANDDGAVNIGDLGILGTHYGQSGMRWVLGDFNGDGVVNIGDLGILGAEYGWIEGGAGGGSVPEPATAGLLALACLAVLRRRR